METQNGAVDPAKAVAAGTTQKPLLGLTAAEKAEIETILAGVRN